MIIFKNAKHLKKHLTNERANGKSIGFAPTMGALHMGHISLIKQSQQKTDYTVVSIFVNPTQFNETEDLVKYPRPTESDIELLCRYQVDCLYLPEVEDVYQSKSETRFDIDLGNLNETMEGLHRPGHFRGVAQVVHLLLKIVAPDQLFMGQKDYQQIAVVNRMIQHKGHQTKLVMCPIIREMSGLAMSSRNRRLPEKVRSEANIIYHTLLYAKRMMYILEVDDLEKKCLKRMSISPFRPEYFKIVDATTLNDINNWSEAESIVACTAVWADDVRLIDNMVL